MRVQLAFQLYPFLPRKVTLVYFLRPWMEHCVSPRRVFASGFFETTPQISMGPFQRYSLGYLYVPWCLLVLLVMVITLIILVMEKVLSITGWSLIFLYVGF